MITEPLKPAISSEELQLFIRQCDDFGITIPPNTIFPLSNFEASVPNRYTENTFEFNDSFTGTQVTISKVQHKSVETEWNKVEGEDMPDSFRRFSHAKEIFKYPGDWIDAYYKGSINSPKDLIIITDNAASYKVGAQFMVWSTKFVLSYTYHENMTEALLKFFKGEVDKPERDPYYQS